MSIDFENVTKRLTKKNRTTLVFEDMTASIPDDRKVGILVRAGEGKTTLANLATGSLTPDRGSVRRDTLLSFPIGTSRAFSASLTARENIVFICRLFSFDPRPVIRFVSEVTGLGNKMDRQLRYLNTDERTVLIFAISYGIPFDTYVIDQTLVSGRESAREICDFLVRERMKTAGFVVVTSSHVVLTRYCDTFFAVRNRSIYAVETPAAAIAMVGRDGLREDSAATENISDTMDD